MANLKTEVDKLDIDKLVPIPVDLSKLSDVVKNDVVENTKYDKLVAKVNSIDTSEFVLKTKYDTDKSELENKISDTSGLVKKTDYNTKITEIEGKIPDVTNLVTKTVLTHVENKIPFVSSLVKKTDYNTKLKEIENKLNNLNPDNLVAKWNFNNTVSSLDSKIAVNKTKTSQLRLKTLDLNYFIGKSNFEEDGTQNYLVFQSLFRYFKLNASTGHISSWKSNGLSAETIERPSTLDISITPKLSFYDATIRVEFSRTCLKQPKISNTHGTIINIYIVYELGASGSNGSDPTLKIVYSVQLLWQKTQILKSIDILVMELHFDRRSSFSFPGSGFRQDVLIFGADISSSAHIDNKKKTYQFSEKDQHKYKNIH